MRRRTLLAAIAALPLPLPAFAAPRRDGLIEPGLRIAPGGAAGPRVALTLDACMGECDHRILDALVAENIKATIFVTARWLAKNADALATLKAHPELFQLENHGAMHIPAITGSEVLYGIEPAGTLAAVSAEIDGGAAAMAALGLAKPKWYRDATALYSGDALLHIREMGYRIGGFSLNGDFGASLPADKVHQRLLTARDGDVIICHINQPKRPSSAGVASGVVALKQKGFTFVRLDDVEELGAWGEMGKA
ncbi:MAG TPA: polysaccharide deacetylase family protein [Devosia sp.]|nr:polysaccharide deacetylase family protein [Devosia sp.]